MNQNNTIFFHEIENVISKSDRMCIMWFINVLLFFLYWSDEEWSVLLNSSPPSATYMRKWIESAVVQIDNGLSSSQCQAIILTNAGIFLIGPMGINVREILIKINTFSFKKMYLQMWPAQWWPFLSKERWVKMRHSNWMCPYLFLFMFIP